MKKFILFAAAAIAAMTACNKTDLQGPAREASQPSRVSIAFTGSNGTKATIADTENEAKVNSVQCFIFNGDAVDAYKAATSAEIAASKMEVEGTCGVRDIYLFVNAPSLASYTSKAALLAAATHLTADNTASSFVMMGKAAGENVTASYSKTIAVDRYASRVRLLKIARAFSNPALQSVEFKVTRVMLTNVVDNDTYGLTAPSSYTWLNAEFANSGAISTGNAFIYEKPSTAISIADGAYDETAHVFYCYPNQYGADDTADPMAYRPTHCLIECLIDGSYYTYPIELGVVGNNKSYEIKSLTITRLGNNSDGDDVIDDGEDDPISAADLELEWTVNDWEEVLVGTDGSVTI